MEHTFNNELCYHCTEFKVFSIFKSAFQMCTSGTFKMLAGKSIGKA
jgi:hypothetical protein